MYGYVLYFNIAELSVVFCDTPERANKLIEAKSSTPFLKHIVVYSPKGELQNLRTLAGDEVEVISSDELLVSVL